MVRRHFFLVGALVILGLMVVVGGLKMGFGGAAPQGGGPGGPGRGGVPVAATQVQAHTFTDTVELLGVAKGRQSVTLTAAATQLVERVRFSDGQYVAQGAVLVELKDAEQNAGVEQARARLGEAERTLQRWRTLADQGFASKAAVDQHEAAYLTARADLSAAEARRGDRLIRAPFAGVVGLTDIAPGALVNPGAAIVTLDDLSAVRVDFQVPERYLSGLAAGQTIQARTDAYPDMMITGRIDTLDTRVDEATRAITARAIFPNPDRLLKPGMMIRVSLARGQRQGLAVPEAAVSVQGASSFVFVISETDGKTQAEQRPVVAGARQDGFVEIRDGLANGDRIVANGVNKVTGGQPIQVAETLDAADVARVKPASESPGA
ncbi:MAG: efflux RND transporter periplasmic adaptor subunit [Phenylobacterium sp.]|uniref:efflux RND transporter periplasmic adaptor subunit n=1 Tax=Phenylobacterium sp. TaxID=1871053 RepID=UPI002724A8F4|nr:efflux RND transporter periplasmic adaptor subunit [Phenylobacterium sp.]MDO8901109.1 efflux RND transporter periplasmic adaptor subunit [Phenylobacterium sp.]MDP2215078.1 efflux RND transporter periplasmic adaptor subunit [Phenylobacterium sp.]